MMVLLMSIGFWGLLVVGSRPLMLFLGVSYGLFLWKRYTKREVMILWSILVLFSLCMVSSQIPEATPGRYQIIEIRNHYCIGAKGNQRIVLYGLEQANYHQVYEVSSVEPIHSLHNIHLFSFEEHMKKRGIGYQANIQEKDLVHNSFSIQARLYQRFQSDSLMRLLIYQQASDEISDMMFQLGLPILGVFAWIKKWLSRFVSKSGANGIHLGLICLYMILFPVPISVLRYFLFQFSSLFFRKTPVRLGFSISSFCLIEPGQVGELAFVLPVCLQGVRLFARNPLSDLLVSKVMVAICQLIYFHRIDFLSILFFTLFRKVLQVLMIGSLFPGVRILSSSLFRLWNQGLHALPDLSYVYVPGLCIFILVFLSFYTRKKSVIVLCCLMPFGECYLDPFFHVYMLDIGQGDCTLIVEPFHRSAVMIDCGQNLYRDNVQEIVKPFLDSLQVRSLDVLIVTHDDFDHSGGVESLVKQIPVDDLITKRDQVPDVDYPFYSLVQDREIQEENDQSILSYFVYDGIGYLWTGDADEDIEKQMLREVTIDVDVLKLGHHGSNTSSSYAFLDALRPKLGLVSVGLNNRYHHPSSEVIARCHQLGISTLQTSKVGMIHLFSFKGHLFFECANGLMGSFSV